MVNYAHRGRVFEYHICEGLVLTCRSLADQWAEGTCFYNICGPTEVTILNSAHRNAPGTALSIGRLLSNTTFHVLDEDENSVPLDAKGCGISVGWRGRCNRGLHQPAQTDL